MEQQIVFFDDRCVLCSRSVRFIYRHDRKKRFLFASFDSEVFRMISHLLPDQDRLLPGRERPADRNVVPHLNSSGDGADQVRGHPSAQSANRNSSPNRPDNSSRSLPDSVVLYRNGRFYLRSDAALRIAMLLRFPLPLLTALLAVPAFIRNAVYDWIARNRYRWFGKRETCFLPDDDLRKRFLE
ncbi:MAG: DCC1-like thiol-disulfide oxidoreductase family protein [Bacteroidales bacterium]